MNKVTLVLAALGLFASPSFGEASPEQKPLVVGTHRVPPFVIAGADGSFSGISIDLWKRVAAEVNLPYTIREVEVADLIQPDKSNLDVVVSLNVISKYESTMDLTHAFYSTGLSIATRPEPQNGLNVIVKKLLSLKTLRNVGILVLVVLLMGIVVWYIERRHAPEDFGGKPARGIAHGVLWTIESLVGKSKSLSKTRAARFLSLFWVFICMLLVSGVTAKLSSELTVSQLSTSVSGPNDLPRVKVGTVKASLGAHYLEARDLAYKEYPDAAQALAGLARGEVAAVVYEAPILRYQASKLPEAGIVVLPGTFQNHGYGFGLRTGSPLRKRINLALLKIAESDEWRHVLSKYLGNASD